MNDLLSVSIFCGCIAAFMLTLARKWGGIEWLQANGTRLVHELASCNFCLSFWVCTFLCLIVVIVTCNPVYLLIPFIATPIARTLL